MNQFFQTLQIIGIIVILTFFQKYYFYFLLKLKEYSPFFSVVFGCIIRFGVIVHEFCHMFFGFLSGNKLKSVSLFSASGGSVVYETKNYIGALPQYGLSLWFIILLLLNQIGIFLTSFGPLIAGVGVTYFLGETFFSDSKDIFHNFTFTFQVGLWVVFYTIFIPSFVLSYEDLSKFFYSRQSGFFSSLIGSIINFFIFFGFLFLLTPFIYFPLLFFAGVFMILFFSVFAFFIFIWILKKTL